MKSAIPNKMNTASWAGNSPAGNGKMGDLSSFNGVFESLVESTADIFARFDRAFRHLYINATIEKATGLSAAEYLGKTVEEAGLPEAFCRMWNGALRRVFQEGRPLHFEFEFPSPEGRQWFFTRMIPERGADGKVETVFCLAHDVTDQKEAELELRKMQARLEFITDSVPVLISYVDRERRYQYNNRQYARWFGEQAKSAPGQYLWDVLGQPAYEAIREHVDAALSGETVQFEMRIPYAGAGDRDVYVTYAPDVDAQGIVQGFTAFIQDRTEEKAKEQQVLREKEQLLNILNAMQDRVCIVDQEGVIRYANPAMVEMYGPAEGHRCQEYLCGGDQPCTWCWEERTDMQTRRYEWTCPRNGKTYDVVDTPIRSAEQTSSLLKIMHDITALKETEAQIRQIQKELEDQVRERTGELGRVAKLVELSHDSILIHDMEGTIIFWNLGAERTFGWTREEAVGQISHELLRTVFREPMVKIMGQIVSQGAWEGELIHTSKSGREVVVESRWALQTNESGWPTAILEIDRDITDRKAQEREIHQHQNQLQALSEQLLIAEEHYRKHMAVVLHDSIGQLLSFSKRELVNLEPKLPTEVKAAFERAVDGINQAISQSRELTMELSSPTLYTFGFEAAIEELGEILAAREGFTFRFRAGEIPADLGENLQILLYRSTRELILNAIRHSRGSTIEVEIEKGADYVRVTVRDDGKGFDVSVIDHYPVDQKKFGLFSIRERLTYIGGEFNIESSQDQGTKVTILAPVQQKETLR